LVAARILKSLKLGSRIEIRVEEEAALHASVQQKKERERSVSVWQQTAGGSYIYEQKLG
jgi:hypothetical protein